MPKKSRQKLKYLENEKSFEDQIKNIFHHFWRAIIEANNKKILGGESPTLICRTSHGRCSVRKVFSKISQNSQENTCTRGSFLIKLQAEACNFIKKETLAEVFSCEFCEISENTFPYRTPLVATSANNNTSFHLDYLQEKLMKTFFPKNPKNPIYLRFWGFFCLN